MYTARHACLLWLVLCAAMQDQIAGLRILATQFPGYQDASAGGAAMHKYPIKARVGGKKVTVYPAAVYSTRVKKFKYRVLRLHNPETRRRIYVHIVDECDASSSDCRRNFKRARRTGRELLDLHWTAWKPLNLKRFGLHRMQGKVIGTLPRSKIQQALTYDGKKGWVPKKWK